MENAGKSSVYRRHHMVPLENARDACARKEYRSRPTGGVTKVVTE